MEQLQHYLDAVNRELDQRRDDITSLREGQEKLAEGVSSNRTFNRVAWLAAGFLLTANLALLGHLFNRLEVLQRLVMQLQSQL